MKRLKILFVSAECVPFAKRGGLGDVIGSLPKALRAIGHDVRVVIPAYQEIEHRQKGIQPLMQKLVVPVRGSAVEAGVLTGHLPDSDVPIYFIAERNLFNRPEMYGYDDDIYRFAFFGRAALELTLALDWMPDILHAHDWHAATSIFWLNTAGRNDPRFQAVKTVFTIHNLAHQGHANWDVVSYLDILTHRLLEEPYDGINMMARGIFHADRVTTVSASYATEIMTKEGGAGLDGLLRYRDNVVSGILNGLDYKVWNPATDPRLPQHYDSRKIGRKKVIRHALQDASGLPRLDNVPLIGIVTRLDWQKGMDIMGKPLHRLLNGNAGQAQFVLLGTGAPKYENMFRLLAKHHKQNMTAFLTYNTGFAPLIYGGCDMFLMPSLFEPCGLGQLIAMRYGTVPIGRAIGGIKDTVVDGETGFLFDDYEPDALWDAMARAIHIYNTDKEQWRAIQLAGMHSDFSWGNSAEHYAHLYYDML